MGGRRVPCRGRGPLVCPRVAACARARAGLCGEAARRCLRVPGACARGCLAPCLCRCLGVSEEGACARSARGPWLPREAMSGGWHRSILALGLFFSGKQWCGGMGRGLSGCRVGCCPAGRRGAGVRRLLLVVPG